MARHCSLTKVSVILAFAICLYAYAFSSQHWITYTGTQSIINGQMQHNYDNSTSMPYNFVSTIYRTYGIHGWCEQDSYLLQINGTTISNRGDKVCTQNIGSVENWYVNFVGINNGGVTFLGIFTRDIGDVSSNQDRYKALFICGVTAAAAACICFTFALLRGLLLCCCVDGPARVTQGIITFLTFSGGLIGAAAISQAVQVAIYMNDNLSAILNNGITWGTYSSMPTPVWFPLHFEIGTEFACYCAALLLTLLATIESCSQCCCSAPEYEAIIVQNSPYGQVNATTAFLNPNTGASYQAVGMPNYAATHYTT